MPIASAFRTLLHFVGIAFLAVIGPVVLAQTSPSDGFDPNVNGNVYALATQSDGKIIVAGNFSALSPNGATEQTNRSNIARLLADGTVDTTFAADVNGQITAVALQPNGQIVIGGKFTVVGGLGRNRVARLNANGSVDTGFDPNVGGGFTPDVTSLALQSNGQVIVGGGFTTAQPNGSATAVARNRIARFNSDGTLDAAFNPNANGMVLAITLQPDGKILIGGGFTSLQPATTAIERFRIARLETNGAVDTSFDPKANDSISAIVVQLDGRIVIGGAFTSLQPNGAEAANVSRPRFARLESTGVIDTSFAGVADGPVSTIKLQPDGRILVGGNFSTITNGFRTYAARILPDGTIDNEFTATPNSAVHAFTLQSNGGVVMGGLFSTLRGSGVTSVVRNHVARVSANGVLDADFRPDANGRLWTVAVQSDGKIIAAGSFTSVAGATHNGLVRLNENGSVDPTFNPDVNGPVLAAVQQNNGQILIGGGFTRVNGISRAFLARLNANGSLDEGFNSPTNEQVTAIAVQGDGKILVGGLFTQIRPNATTEPVTRSRIARLNADGSLDLPFETATNETVLAIVVQPDGKIIISGNFTSVRGPGATAQAAQRFGIARLNADGSPESTFNPNVNGVVRAVARQPDGKIIVGGTFKELAPLGATAATARNNIARINADGSVDADFNPNINGPVSVLSVGAEDKIYVGGSFTTVQPPGSATPFTRHYLVRLNKDGKVDEAFNLNLDVLPGNMVVAVVPSSGGKTLIGGAFTSVRATGSTALQRSRLVQVNANGTVDESFNSDLSTAAGADIQVVTTQADGRVLAAGNFAALSGTISSNLARFHADSAPDTSFSPNINGPVYSVAQQLSKGAPVPAQHSGFAWLESNGQIRSSFAPASDLSLGLIRAVAVQDGKLLLGGALDPLGTTGSLSRFNFNGTRDTTFEPKVSGSVSVMRILENGQILIGGSFTQVGGVARNNFARLNPNGTLDTSFDPNPNGSVETIALQADGKIVFGGNFNTVGLSGSTSSRSGIARLNADGALDTGFNPGANGIVMSIVVLPDAKIMISGQFTALQPNGATTATNRAYIARLNSDGTVDALDLKANGTVATMVLQPDNKLLIGGVFTTLGNETRNYLARLNADGTLDTAFNPNPNGAVGTIVLQQDKILIGGSFTAIEPGNSVYDASKATPRSRAARLNANGTVDATFNPSFDSSVTSLHLQPDGSIIATGTFLNIQPTGSLLVGGAFSSINAVPVSNLALFSADGSISSTFQPNPNGAVYALVPTPDGKVVVGGAFTSLAGATRNRLARFSADDSLDASFNPNVDGTVFAAVMQPDGKLVIGGSFNAVGGSGRTNLARLNADGSLDSSFSGSSTGAVHSLALQSDGGILYTRATSDSANVLERLTANGAKDPTFNPANDGMVLAIGVQTDGGVVVGGTFQNIAGASRKYLARLTASGTLDASFTATTNAAVTALSIQSDGRVLVGGRFTTLDGAPRFGLARVGSTTQSADTLTGSSDGSLTWARSGGSPEIYGVLFESAPANKPTSWTTLGLGSRVSGTTNWRLSGLTLAANTNIYVRARGLTAVTPHSSSGVVGTQSQLYLATGTVPPPPAGQAPVISSATVVNGASGTSFLYAIAASGSPTSYAASGLPSGLTLNTTTGIISGTPTQSGTFTVTLSATNSAGTTNTTLTLFVASSAAPTSNVGRLINLSVNAQVTPSAPIIAGFVISGTEPQNVLLRAIGPALAPLGVTNPLAAPRLRLFNRQQQLLLERDAWGGSSELVTTFARLGAHPFPTGSADAAVLVTLAPGLYSLHVTTTNAAGGIAVAEIYDASANPPPTNASRLVNISARGPVGGGRLVTGGFVITGNASKKVLVRGVGPGLAAAGVAGALADPAISLFATGSTSAPRASNNDWETPVTMDVAYPAATGAEIAAATAAVGGFALGAGSKDAALLITLPPGVYSAQVASQSGTSGSGEAMVEVYEVP